MTRRKEKGLKDRLREKREELAQRGGKGDIIFLKEGVLRGRLLPMEEEEDFVLEVVWYYLGDDIKGVLSPSTFGEPCGITEAYDELKKSSKEDDKEWAKKFAPKKKYMAFILTYKDTAGKTVDDENSEKPILLTGDVYQEIIDHYLDDEDWGDMMDEEDGYDFKFKRTGTGRYDTEYSLSPCPSTKLPKAYRGKIYDLDEEVRKVMPTYEETKKFIEQFLKLDPEEDEDNNKRGKRSKKRRGRKDDA